MAASHFVIVPEIGNQFLELKCYSEEYQRTNKVCNDTLQRLVVKNVLNVTKKPFSTLFI